MTNYLPPIRPARIRLYLIFLQSMFLLHYGSHLLLPLSRLQAGLTLLLATLTLLLLTMPRAYIQAAWFIGLVTLGDAAVLFLSFGATTEL